MRGIPDKAPDSWTLRGNEQTYTLDPNDFDNNNDKIRVRLTDRGGNVSAIESISDSINRVVATTGLAINRTPNIDILQNNLQLSAVVSGFSDANGLGSFTYQWIVERADGRGTAHRIDSANAADYAVQAADIPAALINNFRLVSNNDMRYLVEIRHTDAFGFVGRAHYRFGGIATARCHGYAVD